MTGLVERWGWGWVSRWFRFGGKGEFGDSINIFRLELYPRSYSTFLLDFWGI